MTKAIFLSSVALLGLGISAASPALAADAAPPSAHDATHGAADDHGAPATDIIVTAPFHRDRGDVISTVSILQGEALTKALRPTIGETLARTPGVSATSFGPNASRPVLRGLQGERVRVLTDGIGSIDVSNTSVDHAVAINPLLAERVEVLRGPESLLFGSSAIGGVVNVIDRRIPRAIPKEAVHADAIGTYGSAANERSVSGSVDVPVGSMFVAHADGSYLKTGDLRIGGNVLAPAARAEALASARLPADPASEVDFAENAALRGKLPNSASETWTAGVGGAIITEGGSLGVAYSHYDSLYGVPVRYATQPGQEQEGPRLQLKQDRIDARAEIETGGQILSAIRTRFGFADYRHSELEEDGSVGTTFYNKGFEGRLELAQAQHGGWKGATGLQYSNRDFNVVGDEAFLPKSNSQEFGLFTLQQFDLDALKLEGGARYEHSVRTAMPLASQPQFAAVKRTFDTVSGSLGASYKVAGDWRVGVNLSRTVRAPSAEELFANGPHAGTESFEIGNPDFRTERSWGVEGVLKGGGPGYTFEASAYHNWFSNFIYEDRTGAIEDGLPVYQQRQADARYYGVEAQAAVDLAKIGAFTVKADAVGDYVHATIKNVGPAPRIPPLRLLGGLGATSDRLDGRIEVEWTDNQPRLALNETATKGFTLVNAELGFRPWGKDRPVSFLLSANNIFDVDARRHASFLKDFAPLSGRDIRVTARLSI
ncbi:TonB-dependent receptor [Sphingomonas naphthae]|uniref:TonB-dependent receptor n=1 Tax=Sphingomonas naphthae TaxID=1813468 RepID=A0ABY7TIT1_9SPHN|nr:TonB-dependent receptor [Sphingomonas naphthae]WCT72325.1 TonB-dependent receptor [Sphingomonas naphthae]